MTQSATPQADGAATAPAQAKPAQGGLTRRVFYIPGYDPFHARRYRELYRKESRQQARISGYEIEQHPLAQAEGFGWEVTLRDGACESHAVIEVLTWSDIVKTSMSSSIPAVYGQLFATAWRYIATGALFRLMRLRQGPVIAALYPVVFLLAQLGLAGLLAWGIVAFCGWLLPGPGVAFGAGLGAVAAFALLRWFKAHDGKVFAYYLMQDYAHSAQTGGAYPADLSARLAAFTDRIAAALEDDVDEVLVVGHSSGAYLGVTVLADVLRRRAPGRAKLAYLSLGQVVPMVSFLPHSDRLRGDLQYLSESDQLTWVDVSAPGDGCSFALCDPVAVSGVARSGQRWPLVFSAAFTQSLSPERWQQLKRRYFRLHFQYLCAFDRPKDYDYFQITAGAQTLEHRYRERPPSKSRITRALSKYRSVSGQAAE